MAATSPVRTRATAPAAVTPPLTVLRVTFAVVGSALLLGGAVAVFATSNGPGAFALLVAGLVFVVAGLALPAFAARFRIGGGRAAAGTVALAGLLQSPDPQVRLAAAEAVLDPAETDLSAPTPDLRDLALAVLLDRDLVRRVTDLLRRGGYPVISDAVGSGAHHPAADVLVGVEDDVQLPVAVNTGSGRDSIGVVQSLSAVAGGLSSRSAVVIFTGAQTGSPPLGTATTVGGVQVFSVYSPRLGDEPSVLAAVGRALDAARTAPGAVAAVTPAAPATASTPDPARNGSSVVSEEIHQH